ncbi:5-formyltetrahydrofolate cyclo-ligase [Cyclobacterium lianum]|uniref:5-formyltetrahydrofolate cyclo-ligase n=1 Tax=Cyclobacterium lianum TaxID=388280 RepID=A0A1M7IER7_9BACT|nr:5-formyltetrahydrofolate cyclo-ligase [Cyclobacterium lianum]SHM39179.1 5-formyltetrahydrofolate cyclo-ligase [Cyclobacterium lianum]
MEEKERLRKIFRSKRKAINESERMALSQKIVVQAMLFLSQYPDLRHVHVFLPIDRLHEINTVLLLRKLLDEGYQVYGSVTDSLVKKMSTVRLAADTRFEADKMGIPVPVKPEFTPDLEIELVFVPLLAVDSKGNRIGYGMGYYDRFLAGLGEKVIKVGLSYFEAEASLPVDVHDVPLDACVFPDGFIIFNQ